MVYENLNIIIPCKNEADNLHYIIPKLLTYCNDITVVDGNSEDNTKNVCAKYNVKYLKDNNLGKGAAQRIGANASKKKYIIFFMVTVHMTIKIYRFYIATFRDKN